MSETTTDKIERAERLLREAQEELRLAKAAALPADPCKAEIGGVATRLDDPSYSCTLLTISLREPVRAYGLGRLSWSEARRLIKVLETYIAREK